MPVRYSPSGRFNIRRHDVSVEIPDVHYEIARKKVIFLLLYLRLYEKGSYDMWRLNYTKLALTFGIKK